jgi:hypothetical protein
LSSHYIILRLASFSDDDDDDDGGGGDGDDGFNRINVS